jgi:predicted alpha-1,6-mannanase (GH76 family)
MRMRDGLWSERAERAQKDLVTLFWHKERQTMNHLYPCEDAYAEHWVYWWHAHVIDVLVDQYQRTGCAEDRELLHQAYAGALRWNGNTLLHNWYDDMEWMALALLRAYQATGVEAYYEGVLVLWADIQTAWNDHMGGGMAWKKDQLDYKNTPANAPAALLAARLYMHRKLPEDLVWAERIYAWNKAKLVDPETGFVWDGMNRMGDGKIDKDWEYTYCQGAYLAAGLALYQCTQASQYLTDAKQTASATLLKLVDPVTRMLPYEGRDDSGLFKGILIRYIMEFINDVPDEASEWIELIRVNAATLWNKGRDPDKGLIGLSWAVQPEAEVQLSGQLSGLMLFEAVAKLERSESI